MKNQWMIWCLASALLCVPLTARAEEEEKTKLGEQMESMNDAFKALRRETDPVKGAAHARAAQQAALKSLVEVPAMLAKMPDGPEKAKAAAEFRKMVGKVFVTFCEVEEAFLNGKGDEVPKLIDSLKEMKKTGHDKFVEEDEDEEKK